MIWKFAVCLSLLFFVGCANDSHEKVADEYLTVLEDLIAVCQKVQDKPTARAQKPKISRLVDKLKDLQIRLQDLEKLTPEHQKKLERKFENRFSILAEKYSGAMKNVEKDEVRVVLKTELISLARLMNAKLY